MATGLDALLLLTTAVCERDAEEARIKAAAQKAAAGINSNGEATGGNGGSALLSTFGQPVVPPHLLVAGLRELQLPLSGPAKQAVAVQEYVMRHAASAEAAPQRAPSPVAHAVPASPAKSNSAASPTRSRAAQSTPQAASNKLAAAMANVAAVSPESAGSSTPVRAMNPLSGSDGAAAVSAALAALGGGGGSHGESGQPRQRRNSTVLWQAAFKKVVAGNHRQKMAHQLTPEHLEKAARLLQLSFEELKLQLGQPLFKAAVAKAGYKMEDLLPVPYAYFATEPNSPLPRTKDQQKFAYDLHEDNRRNALAITIATVDQVWHDEASNEARRKNLQKRVVQAFQSALHKEVHIVKKATLATVKSQRVLVNENIAIQEAREKFEQNISSFDDRTLAIEMARQARREALAQKAAEAQVAIEHHIEQAAHLEAIRAAQLQHQLAKKIVHTEKRKQEVAEANEAAREAKQLRFKLAAQKREERARQLEEQTAARRRELEHRFEGIGAIKETAAAAIRDKQKKRGMVATKKIERVARQRKELEYVQQQASVKNQEWLERVELIDEIKAAAVDQRKRIARQALIERHQFQTENPRLSNVTPGPGAYTIAGFSEKLASRSPSPSGRSRSPPGSPGDSRSGSLSRPHSVPTLPSSNSLMLDSIPSQFLESSSSVLEARTKFFAHRSVEALREHEIDSMDPQEYVEQLARARAAERLVARSIQESGRVSFMDHLQRQHRSRPGPGQYVLPRIPTSPVAKWGEQNPKSDIEWQIHRAKQLPGPGEYGDPQPVKHVVAARFGRHNPKSKLDWIIMRAKEIPGPADYIGNTVKSRRKLAKLTAEVGLPVDPQDAHIGAVLAAH